jgi:phospholipase D1/2
LSANPLKAEDFMLSPQDQSDDVKFLAPARSGCKIEPLIDGQAIFPAMEEAIATATDTVYCTFWSIYMDTPLLSAKVKSALNVKDWQGLFIKVAADHHVKVRLILSDFDPVIDNVHHLRPWNAFDRLVAAAVKAKLTADQFQMFVSRHPDSLSDPIAEQVCKKSLTKDIADFNAAGLANLDNSPGIWEHVKLASRKLAMVPKPNLQAFPATYHQKTVIVDNKLGFLGGLNMSKYFQDSPQHLLAEPAHDIFCRLEGPIVGDLERNFVGRWNGESPAFNTFITNANASGKALGRKIEHNFPISALTLSKTVLPSAGSAVAQLHRTLTSGITGNGLTGYTVQSVRKDISQSYERAISLANDYVYIENQVFRLGDLADWLINRFKANKQLSVIVVIPPVAEEIAEGKADPISDNGQALQHAALIKLKSALGKNLGLYSLLQNKAAPSGAKLKFSGSLQIDVHSKILIVDDLFASIGSANASPRSFQLDAEINVGFFEAATAKAFRVALWQEHLGFTSPSGFSAWKPDEYIKNWDLIAASNVKAKPGKRQGFAIPHDTDKFPGKASFGIPDWLAVLGRPGQGDDLGSEIA